jgi:hypothetical protein
MPINFSIELPIPLFGCGVRFEHLPDEIQDITSGRSSFKYTETGGVVHSVDSELDDWDRWTEKKTELSPCLILAQQNPADGDVSITFFDSKTKWFKTHTLPVASIAGVPAPDLISALSAMPELKDSEGEPIFDPKPKKSKGPEFQDWQAYAKRMRAFLVSAMADSLRRARDASSEEVCDDE